MPKLHIRNPQLLLLLISLFALALRLIRLGAPSLWHDEAISALLALRSPMDIIALTAQDVHPPAYYLLLHYWIALGQDDFTLRLLSALASALTVPVIYRLARELFDERTHGAMNSIVEPMGVIAAVLFAFAPFQIVYAQEARMYSLFVLLCTTSSWLLVRAYQASPLRWCDWLSYAVVMATALYTDYFALFLLVAHGLWLWLHQPRHLTSSLKRWLAALLLIGLLYAPWLLTFMTQTRAVAVAYWVAPPSLLSPLLSLHLFLVGHAMPGVLLPIGLFFSLTIVAIIILALLREARARSFNAALAFLLLTLLFPLGATLIVSFVRSIYLDRALLFVAPAYYLLVAWMTQVIKPPVVGCVLFVALLVLMGLGQLAYHLDPQYTKPPVRDVAELLQEAMQPGDIAIHTSDGSFLPARYYAPNLPQALVSEAPDDLRSNAPSHAIVWALGGASQPLEQILPGHQRAWLVVMLDHSIEYQVALRAQMTRRYPKISEQNIGGIQVLLFVLQADALRSVSAFDRMSKILRTNQALKS